MMVSLVYPFVRLFDGVSLPFAMSFLLISIPFLSLVIIGLGKVCLEWLCDALDIDYELEKPLFTLLYISICIITAYTNTTQPLIDQDSPI